MDDYGQGEGERGGALIVPTRDYPVDLAISAWLHAKHQRSRSDMTRAKYAALLDSYRATCREGGYDLDGPTRELATILQGWAGAARRPSGVKPTTYNLRVAVVSSFYRYTRRMGHLDVENPADRVERAVVESYAGARPLPADLVTAGLAAIDTSSPTGRRDLALLGVALATGRRLSEVAGLTLGDISSDGRGVLTVEWRRMKGGKQMTDALPLPVGETLTSYIAHDRAGAAPGDPLWLSYAGPTATRGGALGVRALERICARRLGASKFHATRHTFAHTMEKAGAPVSRIQQRLGHSNMALTGRYLGHLGQADNPYAEAVAAMLGLGGYNGRHDQETDQRDD